MKKSLFLAALLVLILGEMPALADAYSGNNGDRLYIITTTKDAATGDIRWSRYGGSGSFYSGPIQTIGVYKGDFLISDERFISLLESRGVGHRAVQEYRIGSIKNESLTWGSVLVGAALLYYGTSGNIMDNYGRKYLATMTGGTMLMLGGMFVFKHRPTYFSWEAAADAVGEYNNSLSVAR